MAAHHPDRMRDVRRRLSRADEHLDVLSLSIERFTKSNSKLIPGEYKAETSEYFFRDAFGIVPPDRAWGPVVGDVVHNLHAALDYIVCQLFLAHRSTGLNAASCGKTAFPIYPDEASFRKFGARRIEGIHPDAAAEIERLQPFYGGADAARAERHPLMVLYRLEQWDKHRMLHTYEQMVSWEYVGTETIYAEEMTAILGEGDTKLILRVPAGSPKMDVYIKPAREVTFDPDGPAPLENVVETLRYLRACVADTVIPALEPFLKR